MGKQEVFIDLASLLIMSNFIDNHSYKKFYNLLICVIMSGEYFLSCMIHDFTFTIYKRTNQQVVK